MAQLGFFDADRRLAALSAKGDPLEAISALVPWEKMAPTTQANGKGSAKKTICPWDSVKLHPPS